jgi:hypothetical protein
MNNKNIMNSVGSFGDIVAMKNTRMNNVLMNSVGMNNDSYA